MYRYIYIVYIVFFFCISSIPHTPLAPPPEHGHSLYPAPPVDVWWLWVGAIDG